MKAKNKVLLDRYDLYFRGVWKKPHNYPSLLDVVQRRIGWRVDVLRCCDNWEEIVSTDRKVLSNYCDPKKFHFPRKRRIDPRFFDPEWLLPDEYHIVRKKNFRYKVVRNKPKRFSVERTLVVDTMRGYHFLIESLWQTKRDKRRVAPTEYYPQGFCLSQWPFAWRLLQCHAHVPGICQLEPHAYGANYHQRSWNKGVGRQFLHCA